MTTRPGVRPAAAALSPDDADDAVTTDRLFDGRIVLMQFRKGHRVGTDAVLLAAAAGGPISGTVIDIGAGVGAVGIAIAARSSDAEVVLVENDPATAALARRNVGLNRLDDRVRVAEADILDADARRACGLAPDAAALVLTNPPFYEAGRTRRSPEARRAQAHVLPRRGDGNDALVADWLRACLALLAPKGRLAMIHRPDALAAILAGLEGRAGAVRITPVLPTAGADATRILLTAVKASRAPATLAAPLVLHDADGRFTPQVEALHRGT